MTIEADPPNLIQPGDVYISDDGDLGLRTGDLLLVASCSQCC